MESSGRQSWSFAESKFGNDIAGAVCFGIVWAGPNAGVGLTPFNAAAASFDWWRDPG
jgi:hypothetical protein